MQKNWSDAAWNDYLALQNDKKLLKKANELLRDIERNPFSGLGKPEALKGDLTGYWSRRIDDFHRIVYKVESDGSAIYIAYCGTHYHKSFTALAIHG